MKRSIIVFLTLLTASGVFASELLGREIVDKGTLKSFQGTLKEVDSEWYLAADGVTFQLHFGNGSYLDETGMRLNAGDNAAVVGYTTKSDIAVVSLTVDGKTFSFRDNDGRPLWAGKGQRRSAGGGREAGRGI